MRLRPGSRLSGGLEIDVRPTEAALMCGAPPGSVYVALGLAQTVCGAETRGTSESNCSRAVSSEKIGWTI
jgi:hypothetical protein